MKDGVVVINLDHEAWLSIKAAAEESKWVPREFYYQNDWVSDVCG
jgi:hypothetical protein